MPRIAFNHNGVTNFIQFNVEQLSREYVQKVIGSQWGLSFENVTMTYLDEQNDEITVDNQNDFDVAKDIMTYGQDKLVFNLTLKNGAEPVFGKDLSVAQSQETKQIKILNDGNENEFDMNNVVEEQESSVCAAPNQVQEKVDFDFQENQLREKLIQEQKEQQKLKQIEVQKKQKLQAEKFKKAEEQRAKKEAEKLKKELQNQAKKEAQRLKKEEQEKAKKEAQRLKKEEQEKAKKEAEALKKQQQEKAKKEAQRLKKEEQERAKKEAEALKKEQQKAKKEAEELKKEGESKAIELAEIINNDEQFLIGNKVDEEKEKAQQQVQKRRKEEQQKAKKEAQRLKKEEQEKAKKEAQRQKKEQQQKVKNEVEKNKKEKEDIENGRSKPKGLKKQIEKQKKDQQNSLKKEKESSDSSEALKKSVPKQKAAKKSQQVPLTEQRVKQLIKKQIFNMLPELRKQILNEPIKKSKSEGKNSSVPICSKCSSKMCVPFYFNTENKLLICQECEAKDQGQHSLLKIRNPQYFEQNILTFAGHVLKSEIDVQESEPIDKYLQALKANAIGKIKEQLKRASVEIKRLKGEEKKKGNVEF